MSQPHYYTTTLPLAEDEFLLVQVWTGAEITLKHVKKQESGSLDVLSAFKFPISQARNMASGLLEAADEMETQIAIEGSLLELFRQHPSDKVAHVFERVKKQRVGMP